ncbi:MAG: flagellar filament capping protein FliD [Proteocatella sp.]
MYSINTLTNSQAPSSKAIGGLATGLKTDEIIKGMTSSTRLKIARQKQNSQLLSWQTDAFRGISDKLINFSKKFTSFTSDTNLISSSFYTKTDIKTLGTNASKVSVSGSSEMAENIKILSASKATDGTILSSNTASDKLLSGKDAVNFDNVSVSSVNGQKMVIKYSGVSYTLSFDDKKYTDATDFANALNTKLSEVSIDGSSEKLSDIMNVSVADGKISISAKQSGKNFELTEFSDNMKPVLGFEKTQFTDGKKSVVFGTDFTGTQNTGSFTKASTFSDALADKAIRFSLNNTSKNISFTKAELDETKTDGVYDKTKFEALFQKKLDTAFGKDAIKVDFDAGGKLKFTTSNSGSVLKVPDISHTAQDLLKLEIGSSNRLTDSTKLSDIASLSAPFELNIDGTAHTFGADATLKDLKDYINNSGKNITVNYVESLDRFEFKSTKKDGTPIELSGNLSEKLFGTNSPDNKFTVQSSSSATLKIQYGDGAAIELTSDNNTFNVDDLTININDSFSSLDDGGAITGDPIRLSAKTDTSKIFDAVKDMVKDYNDIVDNVNKAYSEKPNRKFPPLTDEQRKEMSESEIKAWEEKAKTGMLFGSREMSSLSLELRNVFYSSKEAMEKLNSVGISTSTNWKDHGKIIIDETKLKAAIDSDPENIKNLFSAPLSNKKDANGDDLLVNGKTVVDTTSGGVMARLQYLTDKYAKTEGSNKGILIEKAGSTSSPLSLTKNDLFDKMSSIDKIIKDLNSTLNRETLRYQKQFANLETAYSKLTAQSGWLMQQFGGQ